MGLHVQQMSVCVLCLCARLCNEAAKTHIRYHGGTTALLPRRTLLPLFSRHSRPAAIADVKKCKNIFNTLSFSALCVCLWFVFFGNLHAALGTHARRSPYVCKKVRGKIPTRAIREVVNGQAAGRTDGRKEGNVCSHFINFFYTSVADCSSLYVCMHCI